MTFEKLCENFEKNLLPTNRAFNYFVDWENIVLDSSFTVEYSALDCLIHVPDDKFEMTFTSLLRKIPSVISAFPILFALGKVDRQNCINGEKLRVIGSEIDSDDFQEFDFSLNKARQGLSDADIKYYLSFFEQMGLRDLFQNKIKKSTTDYIVGVLVGLDSNGRKNRGGEAFELACEPMIREISAKYELEILTQTKFKELRKLGFTISDDIENRKADFILYRVKDKKCLNIEVNFYNGGGSKPEEIIDSYINRQNDLSNNGINFSLITDGYCWQGTTNQLAKGFKHLDYLMNYKMAKTSFLDSMLKEIFKS